MAFKRDDIEQYPYIAYTDDSKGLPVLPIHINEVEGGQALDRTWKEIDNAVLGVLIYENNANARAFVVATIFDDGGYGVIVSDPSSGDFSIYTTDNPNGYPMVELG